MATAPTSSITASGRGWRFQFRLIHFFELTFWIAFISGLGHALHWVLAVPVAVLAPLILLINWPLSRAAWTRSRWLLIAEVAFFATAAWMLPVRLFTYLPEPLIETPVSLAVGLTVLVLGFVVSWAYFLGRRRYAGLLLFCICSPFGFGALHGAADYWQGSAVLPGKFRYKGEQANLDRTTRVPRRQWQGANAWGWPRGDEWIHDNPYELAVRGFTGVFGRMRGVHAGTYPSLQQAEAALRHAVPVSHELLAHEAVVISQEPIAVTAFELCGKYEGNYRYPELNAALAEDCIVLGIKDALDAGTSRYTAIALFNRESGRPFAVYQIGLNRTVEIQRWAKWQGKWQPCSEIE